MTDRDLLELIASQVGLLTTQADGIIKDMADVKDRLTSVEGIVTRIEHDHGQKLGVLFDGHKLNSEKLDRIEAEVSKH